MDKEEILIREYFGFKDINGNETIEVLPLSLVDMLLEYEIIVLNHYKISNNKQSNFLKTMKILNEYKSKIWKKFETPKYNYSYSNRIYYYILFFLAIIAICQLILIAKSF